MSSTHTPSLDVERELALTEIERLRIQVARLEKELKTKDSIITELQASSGLTAEPIRSSQTNRSKDDIEYDVLSGASSTSSKPAPTTDTVVQAKQRRDAALQCGICVDYFSSPFTIECGHTFCFECLHAWLEIHKSCPTCRAKLMRQPTLSFSIREQVVASIARLPEAERKEAMDKVQEGEDYLHEKQRHGDPWKNIFKSPDIEGSGRIIVDQDDGVRYVRPTSQGFCDVATLVCMRY